MVDHPASRKRFLRTAGAAGAGALSAAIAACGGGKKKASTTPVNGESSRVGDIAIVNFLLSLGHLQAALYHRAARAGLFRGRELDLILGFGEQELEHVDAWTAALRQLGGRAARISTPRFTLDDPTKTLKTAQRLENLGAAAYLGQLPRIGDRQVLAAALAIHTVEARHATTLNRLLDKDVTPTGAFARPASMSQVLAVTRLFTAA
jgi:Ferritin-like domain